MKTCCRCGRRCRGRLRVHANGCSSPPTHYLCVRCFRDASTSPLMARALELLKGKGAHTCTSIGSALTGRQSAYGWQTSAREGGRTLRALQRRGLVLSRFDSESRLTLWQLTTKGQSVVPRVIAQGGGAQ